MKSYWNLLFFVAVIPLIIGMGSLSGGSSPDKIPLPEKKFNITFIDQMDVATECRNASIEGNTFIEGKIGNGNYTISFDKISNITFHLYGDKLVGVLKLNDGSTIELSLNKSAKAYGLIQNGTYQIKLIDIKRMIISASVK
jgi:hypothetical protein